MQQVQVNLQVPTHADNVAAWHRQTGGKVVDILAPAVDQVLTHEGLNILLENVKELKHRLDEAIDMTAGNSFTTRNLTQVLESAIDVVICTMVQFSQQDLPFDTAMEVKMTSLNYKRIDAGLVNNKLVKPAGYVAPDLFAVFQQWVQQKVKEAENTVHGATQLPTPTANVDTSQIDVDQSTAESSRLSLVERQSDSTGVHSDVLSPDDAA